MTTYRNVKNSDDIIWRCTCGENKNLCIMEPFTDGDTYLLWIERRRLSSWEAIKELWNTLRGGYDEILLTKSDLEMMRDYIDKLSDKQSKKTGAINQPERI